MLSIGELIGEHLLSNYRVMMLMEEMCAAFYKKVFQFLEWVIEERQRMNTMLPDSEIYKQ